LGGVDKPIILISKQPNRGLLYLFEKGTGLFHPSNSANSNPAKTIATWAWDAGANNNNIVWTGGLPDAISYISLGSALAHIANGMPIKIIALGGVFPSAESIANHSYPIVGELSLVYHKDDKYLFIKNPNYQKPKEITNARQKSAGAINSFKGF